MIPLVQSDYLLKHWPQRKTTLFLAMPLRGMCLFNTSWHFRDYEDFSNTVPLYLICISERQFLVLKGTSVSRKGKFVSSGFGSCRSEAKGAWLPSLMPCCAGLAAKKLTPYPTVAKNAF